MKKTEKIIAALLTMALGVLLLIMKGSMISILMTVVGVALLVLATIDLVNKAVPPAVVKAVSGVLIILFGWVLVSAVLYIVGAMLIIVGILVLYEFIKARVKFSFNDWACMLKYAKPVVCILIGLLLFFSKLNWIFILAGIVTVVEGSLILVDALKDD